METPKGECAHPPCRCPATAGHLYCSEACKDSKDETGCSCGHPGCK